ncbi:MAG: SURF1 family protein [Rickettsiales bacterium]|nr:SURF1 family protein [Rickettsiales bacterium]
MRFRKPEPVPLLFIAATTVLLFGLCLWQVERLRWKADTLNHIQAAQTLPALGTLPPITDGIEYRKVALTGTFMNDKMFHMVGRPQGEGPGFYVVTPFKLDDDGRIILINRGFAPEGKEGAPEGLQNVQGIIRPNRPHRMFMPDNHPEKNVWFYEDLPAMEKTVGEPLIPLMIEQVGEARKNKYPLPSDGKITLRNDHLNYAITWFLLGVIGLVMFAAYHRIPETNEAEHP